MKLYRFMPTMLLACACVILSACTLNYLDEGAINYRKIPPRDGVSGEVLLKKYSKNADPENLIQKDDTIAVYLQQAYIAEFHEMPNPFHGEYCPEEEEEAVVCTQARGEIAIVARVFEAGKGTGDFLFKGSTVKTGRVVYYGDDVRKHQFLNLSHLPIYGPIKYTGKPLGIQLYIIEIDKENKKLTALLSTLANLGSEAIAPSSNVLSLLDTLGTALLGSGKGEDMDDVMFRYSATLMPFSAKAKGHYPILESGHYVFHRMSNRYDREGVIENKIWREVYLDQEEGRLRKGNADCLAKPSQVYAGKRLTKKGDGLNLDDGVISWDVKSPAGGGEAATPKGYLLQTPKGYHYTQYPENGKKAQITPAPSGSCQANLEDCAVYPIYSDTPPGAEKRALVEHFPALDRAPFYDCPLYTEETYLTVHITEGFDATELDRQETLYGALRDSIDIDSQSSAADFIKSMDTFSKRYTAESVEDELNQHYKVLEDTSSTAKDKRYSADLLITTLIKFAKKNSNANESEHSPLSNDQIEVFLIKIRSLLDASSESALLTKIPDIAAFKDLSDSDKTELIAAMAPSI